MYMELRRHHPQRVAAAKTGFSERTGRRIEDDPRLPSQKAAERPLRRQVVDPLGGLWESDILPLLMTRPGVRPVTVLEEMQRSHPDRDWHRLRRTLERRVRAWCAEHGGTTGHGDSNQGEERAHSNLKLPRFHGHRHVCVRGVHDVEVKTSLRP
jgi:hypothetical protein